MRELLRANGISKNFWELPWILIWKIEKNTNTIEEEEAKGWRENKKILNKWQHMRPEATQHTIAWMVVVALRGNFSSTLSNKSQC